MNRNLSGGDIRHFKSKSKKSPVECRNACMAEKRCTAFTFDKRNGNCWLKEPNHRPISRDNNLISGLKRCYYG